MDIAEKNLFMICETLNRDALCKIPDGYSIRNCRRDELDLWKRIFYNTPESAEKYYKFMGECFEENYGGREQEFFDRCKFICGDNGAVVGTCFIWNAYRKINTLHWYKVVKDYEGRGIGRAILSCVLQALSPSDYPVYLHTHPGSFRAVHLYSDLGFALITDPVVGNRENDVEEAKQYLLANMGKERFQKLRFVTAPKYLHEVISAYSHDEF